ncbi:MAG: helix-turn-helix domain-containing protein [Planctomycetes bacterium]|nr:helix-turn-helix domain-containing protein [Planctomycetota bacterium]
MELLTCREVAARLKLSGRQVYKLAASGKLPRPLKVARSTRWRADEIDDFIGRGCIVEELAPTGRLCARGRGAAGCA